MILYTPYDVSLIMESTERPQRRQREVMLANGVVLIGHDAEDGFLIERVVSCNSNTYLMVEYQPGRVIKLD